MGSIPLPLYDRISTADRYVTDSWVKWLSELSKKTPAVHCGQSADKTITTGTWTLVDCDVEQHDNDNMHSNVTNPHRITFRTPGTYAFGAYLFYLANATGGRFISIMINTDALPPVAATQLASDRLLASSAPGNIVTLNVAGTRSFAVNDFISLATFQDSGGDLAVAGTDRLDSPRFWAFLVSR